MPTQRGECRIVRSFAHGSHRNQEIGLELQTPNESRAAKSLPRTVLDRRADLAAALREALQRGLKMVDAVAKSYDCAPLGCCVTERQGSCEHWESIFFLSVCGAKKRRLARTISCFSIFIGCETWVAPRTFGTGARNQFGRK
jgi:hypothetical protein